MVGLLVLGACTPKGAEKVEKEDNRRALTPTYAPSSGLPSSAGAPGASEAGATSTLSTAPQLTSPVATASTPVTVAISDPFGDLTPSPLDPPPPWADLVGADLTRDANGFTLIVRLGGGQAPTWTDNEHTMNIASFYDVDGDGQIDEEVWANLVSGGWGSASFDDRAKTARFEGDSGVTVTVAGDAIVLRFPLDHVANATNFRWSVASEWGQFAVINTTAAARDDMPDNDVPASFPG